ncbi:hypothetical protein GIB67_005111 [Kingdonia uniflora]|uniref:Uncharacterized protein n=1 Tax=Kingdonia uniflora TaxID=39325 RepID=A0A7J7PCT2_9MAGN|nr:hypothetical protein GIB67_005111 [Kingdonia uniflora]
MTEIRTSDPVGYRYIMNVDKRHWTYAYIPLSRYVSTGVTLSAQIMSRAGITKFYFGDSCLRMYSLKKIAPYALRNRDENSGIYILPDDPRVLAPITKVVAGHPRKDDAAKRMYKYVAKANGRIKKLMKF